MTQPRSLNLKHLRYFAEVARRGSVTTAARSLYVAPQTVSAQIQALEESVGKPLFERVGRSLVLTTAGETALDYASAIFALGDELAAVLHGSARPRNIALRIGVTDSVPKLQTISVLRPLISHHRRELELTCREGSTADLLGRLAGGELDAVISDAPVPTTLTRSLQARMLAESGLSFLALRALASRYGKDFPASLDGAPFLAGSAPSSMLEQAIEAWFARHDVRPLIVGRVDDSALLKGFAERGLGIIAVPTAIEPRVCRQHNLAVVGRTVDIRHSVFLIRSRSRRPHPLLAELESAAMDSTEVH